MCLYVTSRRVHSIHITLGRFVADDPRKCRVEFGGCDYCHRVIIMAPLSMSCTGELSPGPIKLSCKQINSAEQHVLEQALH